ncbi:MAG: hypothetical protein A2020_10385 [Lentisphaerae bacterium GWF2_45_14]|nr:MAG: hypothetical protein A2020_10385 [Lentisphaerae bacterium GWF2_45_14]
MSVFFLHRVESEEMRFKCPFCSYIIKSDDTYRGYKTKCPSCEKAVLVPISPFERDCVIADFVIEAKIGKGSIGTVYKATQVSLDRKVALKVLSPEYTNSKGISDFLREARAAAKLSHTNIVQSLAVGEEDGTCYMAMTYITGETLKDKIARDGKIPVDESLHIAQQVAEALYYAWDEAKLIHRDVKPDNIMITEEGLVKLTDLGLAMHQKDWREDMEISGSPSYMSPEQFSGEKLDSRSDIYSLGITIYQMLSGKLPFEGETLKTVARQHFEEEAQPLHKVDPKIPTKVSALVKKMIAKIPEDRFATMEELLNNIWNIRQKTAPNKDLVPDVHTISINRLDYDYQNATLKEKQNIRHSAEVEKAKQSDRFRIIAWLLALTSVVLAISLAVVIIPRHRINPKFSRQVENFNLQAESGSSSYEELSAIGKRLALALGKPATAEGERLYYKIKYGLEKIEASRMRARIDDMEAESEENQKKTSELKAELDTFRKQKSGEKTEIWKNLSETRTETEKLHSETETLRNKASALENENKRLKHQNFKIIAAWDGDWQKNLDLMIYSVVIDKRTPPKLAIPAIRADSFERSEAYKKWFDSRIDWINTTNDIFSLMTSSSSKFSGMEIPEEGKIVIIDNGIVHIQTPDGIKELRWDDLSIESLFYLCRESIDKKYSDNDLKAIIALLKGNIPKSLKFKPEDTVTIGICDSVVGQGINKMKYYGETEKSKARIRIKAFIRQLEDTNYYDRAKKELKKYIIDENDPWSGEIN